MPIGAYLMNQFGIADTVGHLGEMAQKLAARGVVGLNPLIEKLYSGASSYTGGGNPWAKRGWNAARGVSNRLNTYATGGGGLDMFSGAKNYFNGSNLSTSQKAFRMGTAGAVGGGLLYNHYRHRNRR